MRGKTLRKETSLQLKKRRLKVRATERQRAADIYGLRSRLRDPWMLGLWPGQLHPMAANIHSKIPLVPESHYQEVITVATILHFPACAWVRSSLHPLLPFLSGSSYQWMWCKMKLQWLEGRGQSWNICCFSSLSSISHYATLPRESRIVVELLPFLSSALIALTRTSLITADCHLILGWQDHLLNFRKLAEHLTALLCFHPRQVKHLRRYWLKRLC